MMHRPGFEDEQNAPIDLFRSENFVADSEDNIKVIIGIPWVSLV
jgi:hypothetical protein